MKKRFLLTAALSAALVTPALAAPTSVRVERGSLLDYYDRIPAKHFAGFGGVNRRSLLKRRGAIVDYKRNFIEIPGSADARSGDLRALQITLFPTERSLGWRSVGSSGGKDARRVRSTSTMGSMTLVVCVGPVETSFRTG